VLLCFSYKKELENKTVYIKGRGKINYNKIGGGGEGIKNEGMKN